MSVAVVPACQTTPSDERPHEQLLQGTIEQSREHQESVILRIRTPPEPMSGYYKPYQRERERLERTRAAASLVLNHAAHLHKKFGALFLLPRIPATASDVGVREQAKTLLILADSMDDACLKQPFVRGPCAEYRAWSQAAVPLLERLVSPETRTLSILQAVPQARRDRLVEQLDTVIAQLQLLLERA